MIYAKFKKMLDCKKISLLDKNIRKEFFNFFIIFSTIISFLILFLPNFSQICKWIILVVITLILCARYIYLWIKANQLKSISIKINGSNVNIESGNIFEHKPSDNCKCLKVIPFNEYFDTQVNNRIIAEESLNGIFIKQYLNCKVTELDDYIENYNFDQTDKSENNIERKEEKKQKYKIGTICIYNDYLLTAFSKFNEHNQAYLTMPEYIQFLINFWDNINRVYAQRQVCVPIMGSGITRIKEHKNIADEDLLEIMLWTFKISEAKFKYPAKLTIIVYKEKINLINLFNIKNMFDDI